MQQVNIWYRTGGEVSEGLRLLSICAPNPPLEYLVSHAPAAYSYLLKKALLPFMDREEEDAQPRSGSFRREWPFLSEPDCPMELKALAADKITAYHNYVEAHEHLSSCTSLEECFETARKVVENYKANRKIISELTYYRDHHSILGKHGIFAESRRRNELRSMSIVQLIRKQKNLRDAITRLKRDMRKGDRPDLDMDRHSLMDSKRRELDEVTRMIESYGK